MTAHLRLVSSNPQRVPGHHHIGASLYGLALRLAELIHDGHTGLAHVVVCAETLTPIEIGVISAWMSRAGIAEAMILDALAGEARVYRRSTPCRSA